MIYVIERYDLIRRAWFHARHPNGMPMMFDTMRAAKLVLRRLDHKIHRIILVRD